MKAKPGNLASLLEKGELTPAMGNIFQEFFDNYAASLAKTAYYEKSLPLFDQLIELVVQQIHHPYPFEIFHQAIRKPFDYYQFGLDFIRPFIRFEESKIFGLEHLATLQSCLERGENVILLANHQTEPDPQIISLMLEKTHPRLAEKMIFVAGHRVVTDPMAIPMSLGRNLLCIYSKKHIASPPEGKAEKISHNQRTMKKMSELLAEGGRCIYVAPSGGRDRQNAEKEIQIAPFDPQSLELFWLIAQQADKPTHFFPMALRTYDLMPPPKQVEEELGEKRVVNVTPIFLAFGEEVDMEHFPGNEDADKRMKRKIRAEYIWNKVREDYQKFPPR